MNAIVLVDTSVLLNVLDVPGRNQNRAAVLAVLAQHLERNDYLLLPMAAIVETGNHIAQVADGAKRRSAAQRFVDQISQALRGDAPWRPVTFPQSEQVLNWLQDFPDRATAGIGFGDLSIIKEWETCCTRYPMSGVKIWSLDDDLQGFDRGSHERHQTLPPRRRLTLSTGAHPGWFASRQISPAMMVMRCI